MDSTKVKPSTDSLQELRREAGEQLQALRQARGLSQKDLAKLLDLHEKSFVSQFETGRRRPPSDKYVVYARALDIEPRTFVEWIMRYYEPATHDILFGSETQDTAEVQTPPRAPVSSTER